MASSERERVWCRRVSYYNFPTRQDKSNTSLRKRWAIGYGGGSLLVPVMFASINEKTFYVFGALMLSYVPLVYCFVPETAGLSLETIDFLFASDSWFVWKGEKVFQERLEAFQSQVVQAMDLEQKTGIVNNNGIEKGHEEERIA